MADEISAVLGAYVAALAFAIFLRVVVDKSRSRIKHDQRRKFFRTLLVGLRSGSVNTLKEVRYVYEGVCKIETKDPDWYGDLGSRLTEFFAKLVGRDEELKLIQSDESRIPEWSKQINTLIQQHEVESPSATLPYPERDIMLDVFAYLDKKDFSSVRRKLSELTYAIQTRESDFDRVEKTKNLSLAVSVISVIFTVIFGAVALM